MSHTEVKVDLEPCRAYLPVGKEGVWKKKYPEQLGDVIGKQTIEVTAESTFYLVAWWVFNNRHFIFIYISRDLVKDIYCCEASGSVTCAPTRRIGVISGRWSCRIRELKWDLQLTENVLVKALITNVWG